MHNHARRITGSVDAGTLRRSQDNVPYRVRYDVPKVSIGLPVYNGERFLARAIDSHLAQTFTDFELVITDNCSTDATEQIGREYAEKDPRVRYLRNEENLGAVGNFQRAFEETSGPYFRWAAHDDFLEPEYLERTVGVLDREPAAAIVFTGMTIMDENEYVRRATRPRMVRRQGWPNASFSRTSVC